MKNNLSKLTLGAAVLLLTVTLLAGCGSSGETLISKEVNPSIDVLGIKLNMPEAEVHELVGEKVEKAMCIYGYEYDYRDKLINVGFKADKGTVRRITTKNPATSVFGIKPGTDLAAAYAQIEASGFTKSADYKFTRDNIILTVISMKDVNADGITIELDPDQ